MKFNTLMKMATLAALVITGCGQEDSVSPADETVEAITVAELPVSAQSFIEANYSIPEVTGAYRVTKSGAEVFEAEINSSKNLRFEADGTYLGEGELRAGKGMRAGHGHRPPGEKVALANSPEALQAYLATNYPEVEVDSVMKVTLPDSTVNYAVHIEDVGLLIFDGEGTFLRILEKGDHPGPGDKPELTDIEVSELPAAITDYITANYDGSEIERASLATLADSSTHYVVKLVDGPALIFDSEGTFVRELERHGPHGPRPDITEIDAADLPAAALTYIADNYPSSVVDKAGSVVTPEGDTHYFVKLDTGEHLRFDADGNLLS